MDLHLRGLFQGFNQEQELDGHVVFEIGGLGNGAVATAGNDGFKGAEKRSDEGELRLGF